MFVAKKFESYIHLRTSFSFLPFNLRNYYIFGKKRFREKERNTKREREIDGNRYKEMER